jgi:L-amino acid N-acyltransferase YncA
MPSSMNITPMSEAHWAAVREIYAQGIATRNATFETALPDWAEWDARHLSRKGRESDRRCSPR